MCDLGTVIARSHRQPTPGVYGVTLTDSESSFTGSTVPTFVALDCVWSSSSMLSCFFSGFSAFSAIFASPFVAGSPPQTNRLANRYMLTRVHCAAFICRKSLPYFGGKPVCQVEIEVLFQSKVIGTDDTSLNVWDIKLPFARTGRIWPYYGDAEHPVILYDYTATQLVEAK